MTATPPPAPEMSPTPAPSSPATAPRPAPETSPPPAPVIHLDAVSKWFGHKVAVSELSVDIGPGVTGLLGPNGAGKTTLLRVIVGLHVPSRGRVEILGRNPREDPDLYRHIAMVPEDEHVHNHLTARQFVRLSANLGKIDDPAGATQRALTAVDLVDVADRRLKGFSKGMRQRAKVASALVTDPQVLILDEPLNGADPVQRAELIRLFVELGRQGKTVVVSSHVLAEVERMADRIIAMVDGRLAAIGTVRSLRAAITDRPRELVIDSDRPRELAAALLSSGTITGVDVSGDVLNVRAVDARGVAQVLPRVARNLGASLHRVESLDETLESIFRDIAGT